MTTYYAANFSDGTTLTRSTAGRKYTHAYRVHGHYVAADWMVKEGRAQPGELISWGTSGFSGSEQLARKASTSARWDRTPEFCEVAPTVEITRAEYVALNKRSKS